MKTINQVRVSFWASFPEFKKHFRKTYRQNQYCTDIRCTFVDYVDGLQKSGQISNSLANKVTL